MPVTNRPLPVGEHFPRRPRAPGRRDSGFTLIEVLVALLVLSIGLLGVGKLMLFSSRSTDSAYLRSQATSLAYTILDAMRANRETAVEGGYDIALTDTVSSAPSCASGASCSGAELAQHDLADWKTRMAALLGPSAEASVATASVTDGATATTVTKATVTVQWNDATAQGTFGGDSSTVDVTLETVL